MGFKHLNIVVPVPKLGTAAFAAFAVYSCISCTSCSTVLPPASAAIPAGYVYGAYTLECPCTKIRYSCVCCSTAVSPVPPVVQLYLLHLLSFLQNTSMRAHTLEYRCPCTKFRYSCFSCISCSTAVSPEPPVPPVVEPCS